MKSLFLLLVSSLLSVIPIYSQEDTSEVPSFEIEILSFEDLLKMGLDVASFEEKNIFNTPSTVSVIDKETIKRYNYTSISEALNSIAGFSVMRTYLKRNLPTSRGILQDNYANKVLVMINNVPAWHASTGEGNLDRVDINDVERIEVLKGPASVPYGTNAYSGAVNIVLKKSNRNSTSGTVRFGENGLISGGGSFIYSDENYSLLISANSKNETGYDYLFTDQSAVVGHLNEYIRSSNFTANLDYKEHNFLFNTYQVDESYLGVSPAFSSGAGKNHDLNGFLVNYTFEKKLSDEIEINAQATFDHNQRILSRSFDDNTKADVSGQRISGILNFLISPSDALGFNAGIEYAVKKSLNYDNINVQQDNVLTENNMKDKSVYDYSFFGQGEYNTSSFTFLAGIRYNQNEFFGGNISTRGTMVYEVNDKNSIKLVYGSSYRAPSLFEIYFKTPTNTVLGNKDLEPEESTSFEISYLTAFGNFFVQALAYHAEYTNKIFRTRGNFTTEDGTVFNNVNYYTNGNKFNSSGIEIEIKYLDQNSFDAFLNYGLINGNSGDEINGDGHYNFKYVPEHTISGGLSKRFGSFNFSGIINLISERGSINEILVPQTTVDFNIGYSHKVGIFSLRHNISAKNVFDEIILFPEYVSRALNSVPSGFGRQLLYSMNVEL